MYTKQVSYAASQPITLFEAKQFCKVDSTNDDWLFTLLIASAVTHVENLTGLSLASKDYILYLDEFPSTAFLGNGYAPLFGNLAFYFGSTPLATYPIASPYKETDRFPFTIPLTHSPVTAVTKIVYIDQTGNSATLLPGRDFEVDLGSEPARIGPLPGGRWPIGIVGLSAVQVYYTAGYSSDPAAINDTVVTGTPTPPDQTTEFKFAVGIPADLKVAMLMLIADAYVNREPNVSGAVGRVPTIDNIIISNKNWDFSPIRG